MGGDEFAAAARAAAEYGTDEASVRLATDQNFLISHIPEANVEALVAEPFAADYQPDPGPFSRGAVGCTGSEFCNYGIIETKNRVRRWARELDERVAVPDGVDVIRMHMSGCSASCAQPQIAGIGFRGETVKVEDGTSTNAEGDAIVEGMDVGLGEVSERTTTSSTGWRPPSPPVRWYLRSNSSFRLTRRSEPRASASTSGVDAWITTNCEPSCSTRT
ncbi:hypothetical protein ACFQH3_14980 [Haladaptatus sp. GCM10025707]|uniref:hypothetical protein n=1 Tax=Haladaptatus sp. GCM10025707 TaxID=3252658 RepID=UPI00361D5AB9